MRIQNCINEGPRINGSKVLHRIQWKNTYQLFCQKLLGQFEWNFAIMVPIQNYIQQFQLARGKANKGPNRVKLIKYLKNFRTNNVSAMIFGVEHWQIMRIQYCINEVLGSMGSKTHWSKAYIGFHGKTPV
jgi:hypothetical protein